MATTAIRTAHAAVAGLAQSFALTAGASRGGVHEPGSSPGDERARCWAAPIRHLLAPLDGSKLAEQVIPFAAALAEAWSAQLTLLRVLEPPAGPARDHHVDPLDWEMLRTESQRRLEWLAGELKERGLTSHFVLLEGRSEEQILRFASEREIDLIALSSHGEGGISGWARSSTALKVVARAHCSLLIVPAYATEEQRIGALRFRRILVPLDCSARAECVLPLAESLARAHDAELVLLNVVPVPEMPRHMPPSHEDVDLATRITERNRIEGEKYLNVVRERLVAEGVRAEARMITSARSARAIRELAEHEEIDLIVLAAHGSSGDPSERHGGVALRLIHETARPIIVFQDLAPVLSDASRAEESAKEHSGH